MAKKALAERAGPPLSDAEAEALLIPHEVVRDPVHNDITITALERKLIDTRAFQRLRWLTQLGPTQLVYLGATHTRFSHSIGTVHVAEQLVQIANRNHSVYTKPSILRIEPYPHLLIRLTALLHDLAHIPFGHTFEDEGNLVAKQWNDKERVKKWLGEDKETPEAETPKAEIPETIERFLKGVSISDSAIVRVLEDVRRYTTYEGDPHALEYPFVVDLVRDTFCADLLDYLDRDMYFCGLRERSGDRVAKYIAVVRAVPVPEVRVEDRIEHANGGRRPREYKPSEDPDKGKGRVVLLTYRFEREHVPIGQLKQVPKLEILSEAIDLLRRRFTLVEKVYFHRTKTAAAAMLISAMASASDDVSKYYDESDGYLLSQLKKSGNPRTARLIDAYGVRRLYKLAYRILYREEGEGDTQSKILWQEKYPEFRDPKWRREKEAYLERYADLPAGSVVIYCPDRRMNLKEFEVLVQSYHDGEIKPLRNILDKVRKLEMDAINQRFAQLWSFQILVDPDALDVTMVEDERVQNFNALCEDMTGFPNDKPELQGKGRSVADQVGARVVDEWERETKQRVTFRVYQELLKVDHRRTAGEDLLDRMRAHLHGLMGSRQLRLGEGNQQADR